MKMQFFVAFLLGMHLSVASLAQQPTPSPAPTPPMPQKEEADVVRITTNLVQVDAVVTDKNGRSVTDLKPEEIQIFEDGKLQKISHFSFITADASETTRAPKPAATEKNALTIPPVNLKREQVQREIAIVVDDLGLSFESMAFVRQALRKFVNEQMQPGDLVAIIRTASGIGALQQFTSDKRQLYAAIEGLKWYPNGVGGIHAVAPLETDPIAQAIADAGNPQIPTENVAQYHAQVFAVGTLGALRYAVRGFHELAGRKSILLISDGLQINGSSSLLENVRRLIDQASRASVVIYTLNATELQTLALTADYLPPSMQDNVSIISAEVTQQLRNRRDTYEARQEGLDYLAKETGGIAIRNTNDLGGGIRRIMEDQKSYYLIGYRPDESTFDLKTGRIMFHKLTLKVTRKGDFNVRMRNGFYGVSEEETKPKVIDPQQRMIAALESPFGAAGVHMRLTSLFGNTPKYGSYMRSMLHVDARDLTFTDEPDGSHKTKIDFLAITFGADGNPVERISGPATLRIPGDRYQRLVKDGLVYLVTVPIRKPGPYQLRVALRDQVSERVGSASQFVEVPDLKNNRLALSGVILNGIDAAMLRQSGSGDAPNTNLRPASGQNDETEVAEPRNSAAAREFQHGQILEYGFVVYNARLDKGTGQPQVQIQMRLFRNGQALTAATGQPLNSNHQTDLKRLTVSGALRLGADLTAGEYVLQVIATDQLADEKHRVATQWIDFEIVK